jgi:predicted aspartyl protease
MKCIMLLSAILFATIPGEADSKEHVIPLSEVNNKTHVTVTFNGVEIPDILIDTGFSFDGLLIYNPDYRDSLDLTNAIEVSVPGAGGGEPSRASMIESATFELGDIEMSDQRVIVLQSDTYKGFPSNGLIGYSILGHYITEFDYDRNTMTLHHADAIEVDTSWTEIPLYFKGNYIPWLETAVVIEDGPPISLSTYIDYAAGDAILLLEKPDMKFHLPEKTENVHIGRGLSGDIYGKKGYIRSFIIGRHALNNVKASFADEKIRSKQKDADAVLGVGVLRRFNSIFDYKNKKLYIKPNRHFHDPY